jgi:uncharacterized membrane protein YhaH (DUF805 family)
MVALSSHRHQHDYHAQVGMGEALSRYFSNYAEFTGRSNRGEFWWALLAVVLIGIGLTMADRVLLSGITWEPLSTLWSLVTLLPSLALAVRRLHDTDRSGWWVAGPTFLWFAAILALWSAIASGGGIGLTLLFVIASALFTVVLIVWYCQRGEPRPNRFG